MQRLLPFLLAALLTGCGGNSPAPTSIRVSIVDAAGKPANWADVTLRKTTKPVKSRWLAKEGVLLLPKDRAPHGIRVSAVGHRLVYAKDITKDTTITITRGLHVQFNLVMKATGVPEPRAILLRIRPDIPGDPKTDGNVAAKISEISELLWIVEDQDNQSLPTFPTRHWGFGVSPSDAAKGIYFPLPGNYVVDWGLLDLDEGTWYSVEDQSRTQIAVRDQKAPQRFDIVIEEDLMQTTDLGLQERIDAIKSDEADRDTKKDDAKEAAAGDDSPK